MKVYFVRHGESESNVREILQGGSSALTAKGEGQAETVAHRFSHLEVDGIISSDYVRARKTAWAIQQVTHKDVFFTDLLRESRVPSEFIGKPVEDGEVARVRSIMREHVYDPAWHFSDEENFFDLRRRGVAFLDYLRERTEHNVVIVTHGITLRMIVALMMMAESELTYDIFHHFLYFFKTTNTGITICEKDDGKWYLRTWNDFAHLG